MTTSGEGDAMVDALFCLTDPGDEVVLTDPTYAGMPTEQKVAATPMRGRGGEVPDRHVRFVLCNEPVERLQLLGDRFRAALGP